MRVVVVGAGPAGLAAAFGLAERGVEVTVLEQAREVGGRVRTVELDGRRVELGPAGILDGAPETTALLGALGADAPRVITADPIVKKRYVLRDGALVPFPTGPASFLLGPALSWADRLALACEPFVPRGGGAGETVEAFVQRRLGSHIAEAFAQPMVVGVFGGDHGALELESAFPRLRAMEAQHGGLLRGLRAEARERKASGRARPRLTTFEGGMGALPRALARRLGARVRLGAEVAHIERARGALAVLLAGGEPIAADRVVLAVEPDVAAQLLGVEPRLRDLLREIPSVPIASVTLGWRRGELSHPLDGFGLLVPRKANRSTLGVLFMTSIFPDAGQAPDGEVLVRALLGGVNDPNLVGLEPAPLLEVAEREVGAMLGARAPVSFRHVHRWPQAIPQYTVGHARRVGEIEALCAPLGIELVGTALRGVGVNDVIRDAARAVARLGG